MKYAVLIVLLLCLVGCNTLDKVKNSNIDISPEEIEALVNNSRDLLKTKDELLKLYADIKSKVEAKEISIVDGVAAAKKIDESIKKTDENIDAISGKLTDIKDRANKKSESTGMAPWLILLLNGLGTAVAVAGRHFIPGLSSINYINKVNGK